jgi:hypothetical protein
MRARVVASLGLGEEEDWNRRGRCKGCRKGREELEGWEKEEGERGFRRSWWRDITFGICVVVELGGGREVRCGEERL